MIIVAILIVIALSVLFLAFRQEFNTDMIDLEIARRKELINKLERLKNSCTN